MKRVTTRPHDPGLRIFHDRRNENYLLTDKLPRAVGAAPFVPVTKHHRQYAHFDQGQTPMCTGYGSVTLLATAHPFNRPPLSGSEWYLKNVAFDRAHGRNYTEGATVTAALEVGRALGFYSESRASWACSGAVMSKALAISRESSQAKYSESIPIIFRRDVSRDGRERRERRTRERRRRGLLPIPGAMATTSSRAI